MLGFVASGGIASVSKESIWLGTKPPVPLKDERMPLMLLATTTRLLQVLQEEGEEVKEDTTSEAAATAAATAAADNETEFYEGLKRVENLSSMIHAALEDIWNFRHRPESGAKKQKKKQKFRRHDILERQREMLQQKLQQDDGEELESLGVVESEEYPDLLEPQQHGIAESQESDDALEEVLSAEEQVKEDNELNAEATVDPWESTLRTFHSLQILTPILIRILRHSRRDDKEIRMGKKTSIVSKKGRAPGMWLFGKRVFDVCQKKQAERLWERLAGLYACLGVTTRAFEETDDLDVLIDTCQQQVQKVLTMARAMKDSTNESCEYCPLPFEGLELAETMSTHSEQLDEHYGLTKPIAEADLYQQYRTSTKNLHSHLERILKKRFPKCRLSIYGSCLSDLSLGKAADVDLSLCIPEMEHEKRLFEAGKMTAKAYHNSVKKKVFVVSNLLERHKSDFTNLQPVHRARVPVIKGTYTSAENPYSLGGALDFDICFLNDIAVANSGLLREYSLVDPRIKQLMIAVKQWAKANGLSSAQDKFLSSYTWMNLVVYYVLRLGLAPNFQSVELAKEIGVERDSSNTWHCVNNLDTFFLKWNEVESPFWKAPERLGNLTVSSLLYGFFRFYTEDFSMAVNAVSIKRVGNPLAKWNGFSRCSMFLSIEDPFETHDSHIPHDLGFHAGDVEAAIIVKRMFQAKEQLFRIIVEGRTSEVCLWPVENLPNKEKAGKGEPNNSKRSRKAKPQKGGKSKSIKDAELNQDVNSTEDKTKAFQGNGKDQIGRRQNGRSRNKDSVNSQKANSVEAISVDKDGVRQSAIDTASLLGDGKQVEPDNWKNDGSQQNRPNDRKRAGRNKNGFGNGQAIKPQETNDSENGVRNGKGGSKSETDLGTNKQQGNNRRRRGRQTQKIDDKQKPTTQGESSRDPKGDKRDPVESVSNKSNSRNRRGKRQNGSEKKESQGREGAPADRSIAKM